MTASSPDWRDIVGSPADFSDAGRDSEPLHDGEADPKQRGEYERRRGWRIDEGTMKRFRNLIAEFKGTQWVSQAYWMKSLIVWLDQ